MTSDSAPLVSVITPVYNAGPWLADAIRSALAQTWSNIEILVVDDGSLDDSLRIAKSFEGDRLFVFTNDGKGAAAARNVGLTHARGDFIQYLDADDLIAPDKIARQIALLLQRELGWIASAAWARFYGDPKNARFIVEPIWQDLSPVDFLITSWSGGGMMHPAAWLVPRGVADAAGPWDPTDSPNDDGEYFARVVLCSRGVAFCPEARSFYRSGINSLSGSRDAARLAAYLHSLEQCTAHLLAREDSPNARRACAANVQRFIYGTYPDHPELVNRAEALVKKLGGSDLPHRRGFAFNLAAGVLGWKPATQLRRLFR